MKLPNSASFSVFLLLGAAVSATGDEASSKDRLLVLNKGDGTLSIVDPAKLEILTTVPAGKEPHEVVASADGKLAFASNYGDGHTLSVVDLVAGKALPPIELAPLISPHGLAQVEGKIYFTAERSKVIGRCDVESRKVDWVLGIGEDKTHMIRLSKGPDTFVTTNIGSNSISLVSGQGKDWQVTNVPVGKGPEGFDVTADGKEIWVANSQDGSVSIVDAAEKKVVQGISVGTGRSNRLELTPDGKTALVSDLAGDDLVVLDVATRAVTTRIKLGGAAAGVLIDPSGTRAYVALPGKNEVVAIDIKTREITARMATGHGPDGMAWVAGE